MKKDWPLYFIAIVPPEPIKSSILNLKQHCLEQYKSKAALKSPAHITLHMPFRWNPLKEEQLKTTLQRISSATPTFDIELKNFGAFEPRVIYVDVLMSESLTGLKHEIMSASKLTWKLFDHIQERPFHPHMTIAFRDLKKPEFAKAWAEFVNRDFTQLFKAHEITLLKHNGTFWEEHFTAPLAN